MSRPGHARLDCSPGLRLGGGAAFIDGKWKGVSLWHLLGEALRFNQIRGLRPSVMQRTLTTQLRDLESNGFVERHVYADVP